MSKDQVQKLRKENEDLKSTITSLQEEFELLKSSITKPREIEQSVEFLSGEYHTMQEESATLESSITEFGQKLSSISQKVYEISTIVDAMVNYSYQYNIKIIGVPKAKPTETAEDTVELCLKIFKELGVSINPSDIDIAHRIRPHKNYPDTPPIICKFTRRIAKESVLQHRKCRVNLEKLLGLEDSEDGFQLRILEHLSPKQQSLFNAARDFQKQMNYQFCWVRNQKIFLRENDMGRKIEVSSFEVLTSWGQGSYIPSRVYSANIQPEIFQTEENYPGLNGKSTRGQIRGRGRGKGSLLHQQEIRERPRTRSTK